MEKQCDTCKIIKDIEHFYKKKSNKDGRQKRCISCSSVYGKKWYKNNKKLHKKNVQIRRKSRRKELRVKLIEYLSDQQCVDCKMSDIRCFQFDHVNGKKEHNIANMVGEGYGWNAILLEISKCVIRCANCHQIKTGTERNFWWTKWNF